jgi:hypothetical protein
MPKRGGFSSSEEVINHYGAIRMHVNGSGNIRPTLYSLGLVKSYTLSPLTMQSPASIEQNRLSNFTQQKAALELRTTEINETFNINKIIVFVKPIAKSYPE